MQTLDLSLRERAGRSLRMKARLKKRFVDVDIAEASHDRLVEEEWFQEPLPPSQRLGKNTDGELVIQRLRAHPLPGQRTLTATHIHDKHLAEFAGIVEAKL